MWELICHQTYKWHGLATDLSHYQSDGAVTGATFLQDGAATGSGALHFGPGDSVHIENSAAFRSLVGIRVECTLRITTTGHPKTVIEVDNAFKIFVGGGHVFATFRGKPSVSAGTSWDVLNTYKDGLQFPGYRLPNNTWVRLEFVHDGLTQMQLSVNGMPVTWPRGVLSGIPGSGPRGIRIGNAFDADEPFGGDIDEIKVWRIDPNEPRRQFVRRPIDRETADCWARYLQSLSAAFDKHPDCAKHLHEGFVAGVEHLRRAIAEQGPETRAKFQEVCDRYAALWRAGRIEGPKMRALLKDWCAWLRLVGISPEGDDDFRALFETDCWRLIQKELKPFDCDARATAFRELLRANCGGGRAKGPKPKAKSAKARRKPSQPSRRSSAG